MFALWVIRRRLQVWGRCKHRSHSVQPPLPTPSFYNNPRWCTHFCDDYLPTAAPWSRNDRPPPKATFSPTALARFSTHRTTSTLQFNIPTFRELYPAKAICLGQLATGNTPLLLVTMEFPSVAHLYTFFFSPPFMSLEVILFWQPKLMKAFRNFKDHVSGLVSTLPLVKE